MTEYIEREKLLTLAESEEYLTPDGDEIYYEYIPVSAVKSIPAADVRPVVLCRDCQNSYEWANVDGDNYRYCGYLRSRWNHDADRMVNDDDFCKWGRKREES